MDISENYNNKMDISKNCNNYKCIFKKITTTTKMDISTMLADPIIQSEVFLRFQKLRWKLNLVVLIY